MALKRERCCAVPNCETTQPLHYLPSDTNKEWINFIFNEVPDLCKNLVLFFSLNFTADSFTNKAQFNAGFSVRLKLKDDAAPSLLDPTVISHHTVSNCFYYVVTIIIITDRLTCY
ncbi:hypothetical protein PO909_027649 [Leuciscus waleckii]